MGRGRQKNVKNSKHYQAGGARKRSGRRINALTAPSQTNKLNFAVAKKSDENNDNSLNIDNSSDETKGHILKMTIKIL